MFSLQLPHRGDSNDYTIYHFQYKNENHPNYPKSAVMGFFLGPKNQFETAVVNEPSVFKPLKFYCMLYCIIGSNRRVVAQSMC